MTKNKKDVLHYLKDLKGEKKVSICVPIPESDLVILESKAVDLPNITKTELSRLAIHYALNSDDFWAAVNQL